MLLPVQLYRTDFMPTRQARKLSSFFFHEINKSFEDYNAYASHRGKYQQCKWEEIIFLLSLWIKWVSPANTVLRTKHWSLCVSERLEQILHNLLCAIFPEEIHSKWLHYTATCKFFTQARVRMYDVSLNPVMTLQQEISPHSWSSLQNDLYIGKSKTIISSKHFYICWITDRPGYRKISY